MAKLESDIQNRFFDNLINQEDKFSKTPIEVYQKLVFMRFQEVIKNSLPLFVGQIDEDEFDTFVKAFMKDTPTTPLVWEAPKYFRKFLKKNKLLGKRKYLYELLDYDWIEIEIYMKEYYLKKQKKFLYKENYTLSPSARIKRFKYDIIGNDYESKRENFLVVYYDFETHDVIFREINQLIYVLIQRLNKKQSIGEVLKVLCKENDIDFKEAKELLKEPLEELLLNKVFIK